VGAQVETPQVSRGIRWGGVEGTLFPSDYGDWGSVVSSPAGSEAEPLKKVKKSSCILYVIDRNRKFNVYSFIVYYCDV